MDRALIETVNEMVCGTLRLCEDDQHDERCTELRERVEALVRRARQSARAEVQR